MPIGLLPMGAAGAAALGGLFASADAEAHPALTFAKGINAKLASQQLRNKLNKERVKGISGEKTVADYIHRNSNYENGFLNDATKWDGGLNGESYNAGINSMADELADATDDPYLMEAIEDWRVSRLDSSRHSKHGRGGMVAAPAAAAATVAGGADAGEVPEMGWREWPAQDQPIPTSPEERGFKSWPEVEPPPTYWDRVSDPATYADALRPYVQPIAQGASWLANTPAGEYVGDKFGEAMEEYDSVGGFARGTVRGGYGLLSGESPSEAWNAGVRVSNQTPAESADAVEKWVNSRDWHEEDKGLVGSALPFMTEYMSNPLDYAGLGLFGKAVKAVR